MSKKLEQKQQRRLAEERRRSEQRREALRRNFVTIAIAIVVAVLVVFLIIDAREEQGLGGGPVGVSAAEANCTEPETFESQGRTHIEVGAPHEPYNSDPPTSGPHFEIPADTGFYPDALPPEQLIHNMEHGQIIIWYDPDLPETDIDQIEALVDKESGSTVASPYTGVEDPFGLVVTAWRNSMSCELVSEEAINEFRAQFQGRSPEPLTPPFEA
ncbi:MAG: DUF3105 domain-containing protein [Actinomycetota bacterium]|nr:DUF3105 domain-containing protein [Actinomycetota bacterium]